MTGAGMGTSSPELFGMFACLKSAAAAFHAWLSDANGVQTDAIEYLYLIDCPFLSPPWGKTS
jgi:hypothetical protein